MCSAALLFGPAVVAPALAHEMFVEESVRHNACVVVCRVSAVPSSAALALDAADGVIDGKYFGRRIVETVGYACCLVPTTAPPQPHCTAPTARYTPGVRGVGLYWGGGVIMKYEVGDSTFSPETEGGWVMAREV